MRSDHILAAATQEAAKVRVTLASGTVGTKTRASAIFWENSRYT